MQIFTIGHSDRAIEAFADCLKQHRVDAIADVRSSPFSRRFPHFNQAPLKHLLSAADIAYVFLGEQLGACPNDPACYEDGKARYELIAQTDAFSEGLQRLKKGAERYTIALMCAEQDPIACHRAILVCKHLKNFGLDIQHILKTGDLESHAHLEQRLVKLHKLSKELPLLEADKPVKSCSEQLLLFNPDRLEANSPPDRPEKPTSLEALIEQAYQLQAEKIAYIEVNREADFTYEQAS